MVEKEIFELYRLTKEKLTRLVSDMNFGSFYRALQGGHRVFALKNSHIDRIIDEDWVNAIKKCIPNLDAIVNNPRKYMKREEDIVPVEKAKVVGSKTVQHLASHTNYINTVEDGFVKPSKLLTEYNEESLELYENRFIMTLITRVSQFIDRRYFLIGSGGSETNTGIQITGEFDQNGEDTEYSLEMKVKQGTQYLDSGISGTVYEDLFTIRKYINSFKYSKFMKEMSAYSNVRPPILKTNLLVKEPNYKACMDLWQFITAYDKAGYKIETTSTSPKLDRQTVDEFDAVTLLQYILLKKKMAEFDPRLKKLEKIEKQVQMPTVQELEEKTKESIPDPISTHAIRNTLHEMNKKEIESAVREAIVRALATEKLKREMEEQEQREKEKVLADAVKNNLEEEKKRIQALEKEREQIARQKISDALKIEQKQALKELEKEEKKANTFSSALKKAFDDEQKQREMENRRAEENRMLLDAIMRDTFKLEEEKKKAEKLQFLEFNRTMKRKTQSALNAALSFEKKQEHLLEQRDEEIGVLLQEALNEEAEKFFSVNHPEFIPSKPTLPVPLPEPQLPILKDESDKMRYEYGPDPYYTAEFDKEEKCEFSYSQIKSALTKSIKKYGDELKRIEQETAAALELERQENERAQAENRLKREKQEVEKSLRLDKERSEREEAVKLALSHLNYLRDEIEKEEAKIKEDEKNKRLPIAAQEEEHGWFWWLVHKIFFWIKWKK